MVAFGGSELSAAETLVAVVPEPALVGAVWLP